ncbi:MAG: hypothetical protein K2X27_22345 [Candidatus Obscuribacterales bacterium]|nr:hypothetical protein [Candidatus Obscuribacterales bacterium]
MVENYDDLKDKKSVLDEYDDEHESHDDTLEQYRSDHKIPSTGSAAPADAALPSFSIKTPSETADAATSSLKNLNIESLKTESIKNGDLSDLLGKGGADSIAQMIRYKYEKQAGIAMSQVENGLSGLSPELRKKYEQLSPSKTGNYSDEQLAFIKKHLGPELLSKAQDYNELNSKLLDMSEKVKPLHGLDREKFPPRSELPQRMEKAEATVNKELNQLPKDKRIEFAKLPDGKGGNYSPEQLKFIKENLSPAAYGAAQDYNRFNARLHEKQISGALGNSSDASSPEFQKIGDAKKESALTGRDELRAKAKSYAQEVQNAISLLPEKLQDKFNSLSSNKDGSYSREQMDFIKKYAGEKAHSAADKYNSLQPMLNFFRQEEGNNPGREKTPQKFDTESVKERAEGLRQAQEGREAQGAGRQERNAIRDGNREAQDSQKVDIDKYKEHLHNELRKSELTVNKHLAKLGLQEKFDQLKTNKDGTYSREQLEFLKKHSKEAYMGASNYNAAWDALVNLKAKEQVRPAEAVKPKVKEPIEQMQLRTALDAVRTLPKPLQEEFNRLPLIKDGVSYNEAHVNFLAEHVGKAEAFAMQSYIEARRQQMGGLGNKKR